MCGKDPQVNPAIFLFIGSPPHVRERLVSSVSVCLSAGITPACAGKTDRDDVVTSDSEDHPRMCGKDWTTPPSGARFVGSPPHVRERPGLGPCQQPFSGITPACAGKTVMDPFIFALLRLPTFKIYLISLLNI